MSNEKKMFRVIAQTDDITVTLNMNGCHTIAQVESDARKHIPPGTRPYVIQEICNEEEWELGELNFCPRCGNKAYFDGYGRFECDGCNVVGEANIELIGEGADTE